MATSDVTLNHTFRSGASLTGDAAQDAEIIAGDISRFGLQMDVGTAEAPAIDGQVSEAEYFTWKAKQKDVGALADTIAQHAAFTQAAGAQGAGEQITYMSSLSLSPQPAGHQDLFAALDDIGGQRDGRVSRDNASWWADNGAQYGNVAAADYARKLLWIDKTNPGAIFGQDSTRAASFGDVQMAFDSRTSARAKVAQDKPEKERTLLDGYALAQNDALNAAVDTEIGQLTGGDGVAQLNTDFANADLNQFPHLAQFIEFANGAQSQGTDLEQLGFTKTADASTWQITDKNLRALFAVPEKAPSNNAPDL